MHRRNLKLSEKKASALTAVKVLEQKGIEPTMRRIAGLMHYAPSSMILNMLWDMCEDGTLTAEVYPTKNKGCCKSRTVFSLVYVRVENDFDKSSIHNVLL